MSITRLVATYRLTTPMFCAGANQDAAAELRPASFKGVLRFWYRALALGLGQYNGKWENVCDAESRLFGSTSAGQAQVLLSMEVLSAVKEIPKLTKIEGGFAYLAGQGLTKYIKDAGMVTQRSAIAPGARFVVTCLFRKHDDKDVDAVRNSLIAVGLLGGLGARTRRGFGSLTLEKLERTKGATRATSTVEASWMLDDIPQTLRAFLPTNPLLSKSIEYTAISTDSRFILLPGNAGESAEQLLERVGRAFLQYRSYGRNGKAAGMQALQWFRRDHDEMLKVAKREVRSGRQVVAPARAVFGLPHNYHFSSMGKSGNVDIQGESEQRRASPLFFHFHQPAEGPPTAILAFLPAQFSPSNRLKLNQDDHLVVPLPLAPNLWQPIHEFFDELRNGYRSLLAVKFPGAVEVKP